MKAEKITPSPGPLLVFGGPYSNLAATEAVKKTAESMHIPAGNCICTGDIVAYCGRPMETIQLIREWGVPVVMGNCEESLANKAADCSCGFGKGSQCSTLSVEWYQYANRRIDEKTRAWMRRLPYAIEFEIQGKKIRIIHGGTRQINRFIFPSTDRKEKLKQFAGLEADIIIGGHCGIPFGEPLDGQYWLNSGAIGMPANDGTADGWYLLIDTLDKPMRAGWHRLTYDAETESRIMKQKGLDNDYADALLTGLWPSMDVLPEHEKNLQGKAITVTRLTIN